LAASFMPALVVFIILTVRLKLFVTCYNFLEMTRQYEFTQILMLSACLYAVAFVYWNVKFGRSMK